MRKAGRAGAARVLWGDGKRVLDGKRGITDK